MVDQEIFSRRLEALHGYLEKLRANCQLAMRQILLERNQRDVASRQKIDTKAHRDLAFVNNGVNAFAGDAQDRLRRFHLLAYRFGPMSFGQQLSCSLLRQSVGYARVS